MSRVLLIGSYHDEHICHMRQLLLSKDQDCVVLDTSKYPQEMSISFDPTSGHSILRSEDGMLNSREISSVYWRSYHGILPKSIHKSEVNEICYRDSASLMWTFLGN